MSLSAEQVVELMQAIVQQSAQQVAQSLRAEGFTSKAFSKPKAFSGKDEDWPQWSWKFEAACGQLGLDEAMQVAANTRFSEVDSIADMDEPIAGKARLLYSMLVDACEGKAAVIIKPCEKQNGFRAWSMLKQEYEGSTATRFQGMLTALMTPNWLEEMRKSGKDFGAVFQIWETQVAVYELQRGRPLDPDVKVAVVMRHSPEDVRVALRQAAHVIGDDYNKLKSILETYMRAGREYDGLGVHINTHTPGQSSGAGPGGVVPMEVGGLGKGAGKDKGGKPWQKGGKGKDKG
eukprot:4707058-Amphidinium_carterae.1